MAWAGGSAGICGTIPEAEGAVNCEPVGTYSMEPQEVLPNIQSLWTYNLDFHAVLIGIKCSDVIKIRCIQTKLKVYLNKMSTSLNLIALYQCVMLCIKPGSITF